MSKVTRIVLYSLCAALSLSSCTRKQHTPEPDNNLKVPIGFTAMSQRDIVKSATKAITPLSEYHSDFGVWGIARQTGHSPYILWSAQSMSRVNQSTTDETTFVPVNEAFWLSGYTYRFLAVAPYESGVQNLQFRQAIGDNRDDVFFDYDMTGKYSSGSYVYDLMAAAAETQVDVAKNQGTQPLTFKHLFTKLYINFSFSEAKDALGQPTEVVRVNQIRLRNVDSYANYIVSVESNGGMGVVCNTNQAPTNQKTVSFSNTPNGTLHLLPQNISDFELELDFTVGEGVNTISTSNFKIDLAKAKISPDYRSNEWYNWNITISPKIVTFDVSVTPWVDAEDEFEFPIE